jgi:hypothetical protein
LASRNLAVTNRRRSGCRRGGAARLATLHRCRLQPVEQPRRYLPQAGLASCRPPTYSTRLKDAFARPTRERASARTRPNCRRSRRSVRPDHSRRPPSRRW